MLELDEIAARLRTGEQKRFDDTEIDRALEIVTIGRGLRLRHGCKGCALAFLYLSPLLLIIVGAVVLHFRRR